jgi:hypothetical protein
MGPANYNSDMNAADKEAELLLVIPTGDPECPLTVELGWWNPDAGRWEGEWRFTVEDGGAPSVLSAMDPIAWAALPPLDEYLYGMIVRH